MLIQFESVFEAFEVLKLLNNYKINNKILRIVFKRD